MLRSGNLDSLIDAAKEEASSGPSVTLLHLELESNPSNDCLHGMQAHLTLRVAWQLRTESSLSQNVQGMG